MNISKEPGSFVPATLGSDPLSESTGDFEDPFVTARDVLASANRAVEPPPPIAPQTISTDRASADSIPEDMSEQQPAEPDAPQRRRVPRLDDVAVPPSSDLLDRMAGDDLRRRLAALAHLVEPGAGYDRHGLSAEALRRTAPIFQLIYQHYFRVESLGHENVPAEGPVVVASNHAGLLPFDATMIVTDLVKRMDPPRLARSVIDRFVGEIPWVNVFMARMGQCIGTREAMRDLLEDDQLVLVFPEGTRGILKPITQRYCVQGFHAGFVRQALATGAPIIPAAVVGSDDQSPILADLAPLGKWLGLPGFPITPTFPLLGPLGLLPYPVNYRIVYGPPVDLGDAARGGDPDDPRRLARLADRVRRRVQGLLDYHRGPIGARA
jgi:1-acyl-sn-glycerol-3-phosphate acyltransferase